MMSLQRIAEEKIRQAMASGDFTDLKGKGQPLHLEPENPHQPEGEWLAHHLLQQNGFSLPWIELGKEIENDTEAARSWLLSQMQLAEGEEAWRAARAAFALRLADLNRRIRDYNLQVPAVAFQRRILDIDQETSRAVKE